MLRFPFFALEMLITADIGNTSTKFAFIEGGEIIDRIRIPTMREASPADILEQTKDFGGHKPKGIAVASVVRELRKTYESIGPDRFNSPVRFFDHTSQFGFSINYEPPSGCGPDRLVAAHAALLIKASPVIVCDFGTATTIDLVNDSNEYSGGIIAPGIETMANSLFESTSRLPKIEIGAAHRVVGNSTERSIRSGIYFGYLGLADGIIDRMQSQLESPARVVSTGGYAELIARESKFVNDVEPDLINHGLLDLWKRSDDRNSD